MKKIFLLFTAGLLISCATLKMDKKSEERLVSQGTKDSPFVLETEKEILCTVGPDSKSYYSFTLKKGPEFQIIARDFAGQLKITNYNTDYSFEFPQINSEGQSPLSLEGWFFVIPGETYYFTVEETPAGGMGASFKIFIREYDHKQEKSEID